MKKILFCLIILLLAIANMHGQTAENDCIKGQIIGMTAEGKAILEMTNKQSCTADVGYDIGIIDGANKLVLPGETDTFEITVPNAGIELLLETNTSCTGACDQTQHLPLLVKLVNTPVTGLDSYKARYLPDSGKIEMTLTTLTEVDNKGFMVMIHGNPVAFGVVPTKALGGFSTDPIDYRATIDVIHHDAFNVGGFGLDTLLVLLLIGMALCVITSNVLKRYKVIMIAFIALGVFASCKKDSQVIVHGTYDTYWVQVDNNGQISGTTKVVPVSF